MLSTNSAAKAPEVTRHVDGRESNRHAAEFKDRSYDKTVDADPQPDSWKILAVGTVVPLGMAGAAAFASYVTTYERVAITAWIAVAVVGSASVIAAASVSRRRVVMIDKSQRNDNASGK